MPADDNQKVEDALQAIRSLVEANGLSPSADDGVIHLDSIVWRGNPEEQQAAQAQPHNDSDMAEDTLPILPQSMSGFASMTALAEEAEQTPSDSSFIASADEAESAAVPGQADIAPAAVQVATTNTHQSASADAPQTGRELAETRALLAEFQSLLDSTIKQQEQISATSAPNLPQADMPVLAASDSHDSQSRAANDLAAQADAAEAMSTLAKAALDARLSTPHVAVEPTNAAPAEPARTDAATETAPMAQPDAPVAADNQDSQAEETAESTSARTQSESSSAGSISKMALHLVDAAESSEDTGNHLFTSAVRSTMQEIIRRQMTEWLTANMTDIIEDALRDEMRPAKSTRRFDRDR